MNKEILRLMLDVFPKMQLKGDFNTWVMVCPFHEPLNPGKLKPQFFVDIKSSNYNCIGCGTRGKLKDLIRDLEEKTKVIRTQ